MDIKAFSPVLPWGKGWPREKKIVETYTQSNITGGLKLALPKDLQTP